MPTPKKKNNKRKIFIIIVAVIASLLAVMLVIGIVRHLYHPEESIFFNPLRHSKVDTTEIDSEAEGVFTLAPGNYYRIVVNNDTAFFNVKEFSGSHITGQYFPLENGSDCVVPHPFEVVTRWKSSEITIGDSVYRFKIMAQDLGQYTDSDPHQLVDDKGRTYNILITRYVEPEYTKIVDRRYQDELFSVATHNDIIYGYAQGYWTSMVGNEAEGYGKIVSQGLKKTLKKRNLALTLDLYQPQDNSHDATVYHPLIVFLHGGAFYVGDKDDPAIVGWCRHFATMGYVTASINYRMGFVPSKKEIQKTGYDAVADVQNAVRFLKAHAEDYCIDTNLIFAAGTSAGSITILNVAFAPHSDVRFKAVANMWGALTDIGMLRNSRTDIVSFHGDADQLVPYEQGFPFSDINGKVGQMLFAKMYGSKVINQKAKDQGLHSRLYTFPHEGHALHLNKDHSINYKNYHFIQDSISAFFYRELVPRPVHVEQDNYDNRHFLVDNPNVNKVVWNIDGGFIVRQTATDIWVVWRSDPGDSAPNPRRNIEASGYYTNGIGFNDKL